MTVSPSCIYVSMPAGHGTTPFSIDDLCHTEPFAFSRVLSIAVIERSTNPSMQQTDIPLSIFFL